MNQAPRELDAWRSGVPLGRAAASTACLRRTRAESAYLAVGIYADALARDPSGTVQFIGSCEDPARFLGTRSWRFLMAGFLYGACQGIFNALHRSGMEWSPERARSWGFAVGYERVVTTPRGEVDSPSDASSRALSQVIRGSIAALKDPASWVTSVRDGGQLDAFYLGVSDGISTGAVDVAKIHGQHIVTSERHIPTQRWLPNLMR